MKPPKVVKVGCFDIKLVEISQDHADDARIFGRFNCVKQEVQYSSGLANWQRVDTVLHELNHAIYWAYGIEDEDKEERVCGAMATSWASLYRDNPDFVAWLYITSKGR